MKQLNDFIGIINQGVKQNSVSCNVKKNKVTLKLCDFLYKEGIFSSYMTLGDNLIIFYRYNGNKNIIKNIRAYKPLLGNKSCYTLKNIKNKFGDRTNCLVLETSKGFLFNNDALLKKVSGRVLIKLTY